MRKQMCGLGNGKSQSKIPHKGTEARTFRTKSIGMKYCETHTLIASELDPWLDKTRVSTILD